MTDSDLLRQFVDRACEQAFAELVHRRVDLVFAAALRQLAGDRHKAEDVTQEVFVSLGRKAPRLTQHPDLLGWLYTTTHFAALNCIRTEERRRRRERETFAMQPENSSGGGSAVDWRQLQATLDDAMHDLSERDRQIVLLRFFDKQSFAAIGAKLGVTENAAQKSTERSLDKLQASLARRGIRSTGAALSGGLATAVAAEAPAGLAATVTGASLAAATTAGAGLLPVVNSAKVAVMLAGGVAVVTFGFLLVERRDRAAEHGRVVTALEGERRALQTQIAALTTKAVAAEERAQAAEDDAAKLIEAVGKVRSMQKPASGEAAGPRDTSLLSREAALAELSASVEKFEMMARAKPGYRPYQPPDESTLAPEQRATLERARAAARAKNRTAFVVFGAPGGTIYTPPFASELLMKAYPQLTASDWQQLNDRYARALVENEMADWMARSTKEKK